MNYDLLNKKIDQFLAQTAAEDLIKEFEELGYSFYKEKMIWEDIKVFPQERFNLKLPEKSFWKSLFNSSNSITPNYSEFFFA